MGKIISVFTRTAFKEFILPAADNMDHTILMKKQYFCLRNNVALEFEVLSGEWYIKDSKRYAVRNLKCEDKRYKLKTNEIVKAEDQDNGEFRLILKEVPLLYNTYSKYSIRSRDTVSIGRLPDNDIYYDQLGLVSKHHAIIEKNGGRWLLRNKSKNGTYVDSSRVMDAQFLDYGSVINIIGLSIVFLGDVLAIDDASDDVHIAPGLTPYVPENDTAEEGTVCTGFKSYVRAGQVSEPEEEDFSIELPVIGVSRWKETYRDYLDKKKAELEKLAAKNRDRMTEAFPSTQEILNDYDMKLSYGDRDLIDSGMMKVRIGTGSIASPDRITFDEGRLYLTDRDLYDRAVKIKNRFETMDEMPYSVDLEGHNSVLISSGDIRRAGKEAMSVSVQLTQHLSPACLRMGFIFDEKRDEDIDWSCMRWLPHVWSEDISCRYFARENEEAGETVYRLSRVLLSREDLTRETIDSLPRYVIFVSGRKAVAGTLLEKYMMQRRYLGFTIVYLGQPGQYSGGPSELEIDVDNGTLMSGILTESYDTFTLDDFNPEKIDGYVRRMAAIRNDISDGIAIIPDFVSLFDAMEITDEEELHITERWAKNRTYDHIRGILGVGAGNMPRYLDLHERYNGPHALIAGTTGSGKSELMQTILLSLAAEYSPKDLNFVLIDFKGGGMANDLKSLPHVSGCITNLSGVFIERAMLAVKSEILRRQRTMNDYGINHIDDYMKLFKSNEVSTPMPHLVIAIDEFAELKKEKPDFMRDLISIAQTGRSLGIHLLLATQRPRGNVDDDIRYNMRSAICFRVQDRQDSMDVLDRPDAAYITGSGRAYLEVGAGEIFEPFQAAFSGQSRMTSEKNRNKVVMLTDDGRADVVSSFEEKTHEEIVPQLELIRNEIRSAADRTGLYAENLWLDSLDKEFDLQELLDKNRSCASDSRGETAVKALIGMIDDPEERTQYPLSLTFPGSGNVAIAGMPSSGKTTAIETIAASLVRSNTPDEVIIYGMDLDSGRLASLEEYEHVKYIVTGHDVMAIESLLDELSDIQEERKASGSRNMPCCAVFIDSYEDLRNIAGYRAEKKLSELMREAQGVSMYFIISGGGFGIGQISGSVERNVKTVLSLEQRNRYEYKDVLHTSDIRMLPPEDVKGRGLTVIQGRVLEFQLASSR